ncbi:MAG: urea carboxylase [Chthoniobacter sp.]|jgi:urea carboxylase|nr:urea carboxylase [Chthoniobacter sp.]
MFSKVLIANRGVISRRITRTLQRLGIGSIAVYSEADAHSLHVTDADEAVLLGPAPPAESYLRIDRILAAAAQTGAQAIHPGYGFLSENADFAEACERAGLAFIGPTPAQMRAFGLKHTARALAREHGVPLLPGTDLLADANAAEEAAERIGYPVMLKSSAGGGGIGMRVCGSAVELREAFVSVQRLGESHFQGSGIFLEKFVARARHLEVQIFGDGAGRVVALGERDCSAQRRNQKVIEETPAPGLGASQRAQLAEAAVKLGQAVNYRSAGTVEFVFDAESGAFYFLEVNTRLQVEHGVTEEVTGVDLVEWMVRLAAGDPSPLDAYQHQPRGHSIQVRIYAEDPHRNFQPSCGVLTEVSFHESPRCETWVENGTEVTPFYDPMLAKIIVHADDRATAIARLRAALEQTVFGGIESNLAYLRQVIASPVFAAGGVTTGFLGAFAYEPRTIDVLEAGAQTTVQDYPGRIGFWAVGVPPSGPMDHLAFRFANRLVGNPESAAGLEIMMTGPTLRFNAATEIALTGADLQAEINGIRAPRWETIAVNAGDVLRMRAVDGAGARACLAVRGGLQEPRYLGSRATFTLGKFGGHGGRALRLGDVLHLGESDADPAAGTTLPSKLVPVYPSAWEIGVLYGPHGAPDFFTEDDMAMLFATDWKVHYNSNRTGIRLVGPKPQWARPDGGEAGLHPSNLHDNAYAIGAIDFTGDMPIILGPDGPSLGGFVCPACIVQSELWKIGQLRPGNTVRFHRLPLAEANARELEQDREIESLVDMPDTRRRAVVPADEEAVEHRIPAEPGRVEVCYRRAGDKYLLVEYGPLVLDLPLRFRAHALMQWLEQNHVPGILDLTPGIRSLQIHYDCRTLPLQELTDALLRAESELPELDEIEVPSRIVHLPLSWDDPSTRIAIEKYMQSVRPDAPWCPSNLEFIRRINGLPSIEEVQRIVFEASYLVLGLGDVYLGAPVATPLDPRHRLVTTKYNPARTWTPENAVGIGGAYLCIYGMEGPGGYQFVGRTVQVWNTYRSTRDFEPGKPWLLRFFDQIRFYPVTAAELRRHRGDFLTGRFRLRVEEETFRLSDYQRFLASHADSIDTFRAQQRAAFAEERERWVAAGQNVAESEPETAVAPGEIELPPGARLISAHLPGSVWQVVAKEGETVAEGDKLLILESMKMEIAITAPAAGRIERLLVAPGRTVEAGQALAVLVEV